METKQKYENRIKSFADDIDKKILQLESKIDDIENESKSEYLNQLSELREKKQTIQNNLSQIKTMANEEWNEAKEDLIKEFNNQTEEFEAIYDGVKEGFDYLFKKL